MKPTLKFLLATGESKLVVVGNKTKSEVYGMNNSLVNNESLDRIASSFIK